mmetsp:Transcript_54053/g.128764  ORF Transcript_54053/g.128764 Transcript_54053/m.128764 type:complete len:266 (+) Transcript_54053:75-872(+)
MKTFWEATSRVGLHPATWLGLVYRDSVFSFPADSGQDAAAVEGYVALTIDDGICRQGDLAKSMAPEVEALLKEYDAKVTFFLCSNYVQGFEEQVSSLVADGHELGNHGTKDANYSRASREEFEEEFLQVNSKLQSLQSDTAAPIKWFRAPQGIYTSAMRSVVNSHSQTHILGDCFCDDYANTDTEWVAKVMLRQVRSGSILVMHMPERGHWEHTFDAIKLVLEGLKAKGLRSVTLSKLQSLAAGGGPAEVPSAAPPVASTSGEAT